MDGNNPNPTDKDVSEYKTPNVKPKTMKLMWACDVCQEIFPDFDQACRHEENCRANQERRKQQQASKEAWPHY